MAESLKHTTKETFKADVLDSSEPVLVDFYADWCGPCRAIAPTLAELSAEGVKVVKVDAEAERDLCSEYGVSALPTLLVIKGGEVKAKMVGLQNKARLVEALNIGS